jgi:cell envelope opacity-associated protein A
MEYTFASQRQLSFIVSAGGRNYLVSFGNRNQAGVAHFMTRDDKVAQAVRRHSLSRRGVIVETTKEQPAEAAKQLNQTSAKPDTKTAEAPKPAAKPTKPAEDQEREYDNYTVARESICKELGIKKSTVRNPNTLAQVAKEHGIIIKFKEL